MNEKDVGACSAYQAIRFWNTSYNDKQLISPRQGHIVRIQYT